MSRRRKAERRSQASAVEAVCRAGVEQDGDTPGTVRGGKEARQAWLESRIRAPAGGTTQETLGSQPTWPAGPASPKPAHRRSCKPGRRPAPLRGAGRSAASPAVSQSTSISRAGACAHPAARAWSRRAAGRPVPGRPAGLDGERRLRQKEGPRRKPFEHRGTKSRRWGESTAPESSGAVDVAPNALGVKDASVVPRGPARAVPVSSGGLGGASVRSPRCRFQPQMRWRGQGRDRARARPFTGGQRPDDFSNCCQNRGPGSPWRKPKPPRREACIPSAACWGRAGHARHSRSKLGLPCA